MSRYVAGLWYECVAMKVYAQWWRDSVLASHLKLFFYLMEKTKCLTLKIQGIGHFSRSLRSVSNLNRILVSDWNNKAYIYICTLIPFTWLTWTRRYTSHIQIFFGMLCAHRPPLWSSGQSSWLQIQRSLVRFPALPDFQRSNGSETGSTQPREYNWGATWKKK
jgi:hypothetical protein